MLFVDNKFNLSLLYQSMISIIILGLFIFGIFRFLRIIFQGKAAIIFTTQEIEVRIGSNENYIN